MLNLFKLERLKLRKNSWGSNTYEFDEVLTEFASQKRVYEVIVKPAVEIYCNNAFPNWSRISFS